MGKRVIPTTCYTHSAPRVRAVGLFIKGLSFFSHLRIISTWGGLKQALVDEALTVVELISQRKERER